MPRRHLAYIALGGNLDDREACLNRAVDRLAALGDTEVAARSPLLPYAAEGAAPDAPDYLNGAVALATDLSPAALHEHLQAIEAELGRPDIRQRSYHADRTADLDLLLYDQLVLVTRDLVIPHPRMHRRRFVLEPLVAIAPEVLHPVFGLTASRLLKRLEHP